MQDRFSDPGGDPPAPPEGGTGFFGQQERYPLREEEDVVDRRAGALGGRPRVPGEEQLARPSRPRVLGIPSRERIAQRAEVRRGGEVEVVDLERGEAGNRVA